HRAADRGIRDLNERPVSNVETALFTARARIDGDRCSATRGAQVSSGSSYAKVHEFLPTMTGTTADANEQPQSCAGDPVADALGRRTARGAVITTLAQAAAFVMRMGSMSVLARLVAPRDFGLVGMVTAFTGVLGLLRDGGL